MRKKDIYKREIIKSIEKKHESYYNNIVKTSVNFKNSNQLVSEYFSSVA
ncbi:hypothetical protein HMPREF1987_01298 [Peptostreptococcaceae bacterium oral taxon 113 str. W5053]|nr:hypothetical protein HMPREF1987_01298 [Peptostreptococcaceae bacterium oral taxon 113 str. W5053]